MIAGGAIANQTGDSFEDFIEWMLTQLGYEEVKDKQWLWKNRHVIKGKYYAKQVVVGESIYEGKKRKVDFLAINDEVFLEGVIIECKWQDVAGSKEEVLPYLYLCIEKTNVPTIIAFDGNGFTVGAKKYIKSKVDHHIVLAVWSMQDFQRARNSGFFGDGTIPTRQKIRQADNISLWDEGQIA